MIWLCAWCNSPTRPENERDRIARDRMASIGLDDDTINGLMRRMLEQELEVWRQAHGYVSHGLCPSCYAEQTARITGETP